MDRPPSPVREPEAYIPCEPGPEVERFWLPETRAFAVEWARQARVMANSKLDGKGGLAVDDATLERVADAIMDPAHPPPWQPLTAVERRDEFPGFLWDKVQDYLAEHRIAARVDVRWHGGKRTIVVGILGDPEPHQAALRRITGSRVIVRHRPPAPPHTAAELAAVTERISADKPELARSGLHVRWLEGPWRADVRWLDGPDDVGMEEWEKRAVLAFGVEVHVAGGPDERAVAEAFAARYGDAVTVRWLGPSRVVEGLRPFGSWASDGHQLRVFYELDPNGHEPGEARVAEESHERIVIALSSIVPADHVVTAIGGFHPRHADVELREPVGDRAVIDASAGVPRPALAELRSRSSG